MDTDAVFAACAANRRDVADLLEGLDTEQLAIPSLCARWDVRTVGAHLAAAAAPSMRPFLVAVLRHAGSLHRANDTVAREVARRPVAQVAALLRDNADRGFSPPLAGPRGPLTDVLVHAGDMRVPLELPHDPPGAHVRMGLEFVTGGRPYGFVPRGRLDGLRLVASDLDWSWGGGPQLTGRGVDLLMAACGRTAVLPRLGGEGVGVLARRLPGGRGDSHRS